MAGFGRRGRLDADGPLFAVAVREAFDEGNFDNLVAADVQAGGFDVEDNERAGQFQICHFLFFLKMEGNVLRPINVI